MTDIVHAGCMQFCTSCRHIVNYTAGWHILVALRVAHDPGQDDDESAHRASYANGRMLLV